MKCNNYFLFSKSLLFLSCVLFFSNAPAQTWISPTKSETMLGQIANPFLIHTMPTINCANITYDNSGNQLSVICWDEGGTGYASGPGFVVFDGAGNSFVETHPSTLSAADHLDICIGNIAPSGSQDNYRIAVVYSELFSGDIRLDLYDVTGIGTPALSTNYNTTIVIAKGFNDAGYGSPHIDIIEETGNTGSTILGKPYCNQFVVTYNGSLSSGPLCVYGYKSDLNLSSSASAVFNPASIHPYLAWEWPDVAGIQINTGGTPTEYARFTWGDNSGHDIWYAEWDITAGTTTTPTTVLSGGWSGHTACAWPRIDAIDDYNTSMTPNQADYQVVSTYYDVSFVPCKEYILSYNNLSPLPSFPFFGTSISSPFLDNDENHDACVAAGPGNIFTAAYYSGHTNPTNGTVGHNVAQTIDVSTGTLSGLDYLQIDNNWVATNGISNWSNQCMVASTMLAVSTSCNTNDQTLAAYCYNMTDLYYKFTGNPVSFKPGANYNKPRIVNIFPIPANDVVNIWNADINSKYTIADVTGKIILSGAISNEKQLVDISMLTQGMYVLSLYNGDSPYKITKLLKQ